MLQQKRDFKEGDEVRATFPGQEEYPFHYSAVVVEVQDGKALLNMYGSLMIESVSALYWPASSDETKLCAD
jgi:hypothetical protein